MPSAGDARHGAQQVANVAKANPMALAIGALVLGAAAGIALPKTRIEEEKVGPVAGDLRERGVEKATEAVQQGREVISEKASEVAERGQEAVAQATDQARERVHEAADKAGSTDAGSSSREASSLEPGSSGVAAPSGGAEGTRPAGEPARPVS